MQSLQELSLSLIHYMEKIVLKQTPAVPNLAHNGYSAAQLFLIAFILTVNSPEFP